VLQDERLRRFRKFDDFIVFRSSSQGILAR